MTALLTPPLPPRAEPGHSDPPTAPIRLPGTPTEPRGRTRAVDHGAHRATARTAGSAVLAVSLLAVVAVVATAIAAYLVGARSAPVVVAPAIPAAASPGPATLGPAPASPATRATSVDEDGSADDSADDSADAEEQSDGRDTDGDESSATETYPYQPLGEVTRQPGESTVSCVNRGGSNAECGVAHYGTGW